jgi:glycosyltransferase involved in cell wall biosynthesis
MDATPAVPVEINLDAVRLIVFSKDRPLQLDATLKSIQLNLATGEAADIHVLYRASTPRYAAGYRVLTAQHPRATLHVEADFKRDLTGLLNRSPHVLFLVDDTIFVAEFSLATAIDALARDPSLIGFSYRLGRNTTYCYTLDRPQRRPAFEELGSGVLAFDWTQAEYDFGYPLELSSSLYRTADLLPQLQSLEYRDPNTLEAALWKHIHTFREKQPRLASYEQSVAVSVPANMVQTAWKNRADSNPALTAEALAHAFARGDRLDVGHYRGLVPNACHQELEFAFERDPAYPTISVVIPCFDQAQYLPDAVRSVASQTFTRWEIIIVDDGSPDDTQEVARRLVGEYGDSIRLVRQSNAGLASARNAGIAQARGEYVIPLDADDMFEPTMLEETLAILESDETVGFVYTDAIHFDDQSERVVGAAEYRFERLLSTNIPNYSALYARAVWEAVGGYNSNMRWGYEDWDFWLGCGELGIRGRRLARPLLRYRVRAGSMYSTALVHDQELRAQLRINHPRSYGWRGKLDRLAGHARRAPSWLAYHLRRGAALIP